MEECIIANCRKVERWGNTAHPNPGGGDLSLYSANGLEYKMYMPNMGRHAQYGPIQIHGPIQCLIPARSRSIRQSDAKTGSEILEQLDR